VLRATSPATLRGRRPVEAALVRAADAVAGRGLAETELPAGTACVLVVLRGLGPAAAPAAPAAAGLLLGLDGAEQARDPAGELLPPIVVGAGTRACLCYAIVPAAGRVTVTVGHDDGWALDGVLGSPRPPAAVARWLAELGVDGLAAGLADPGNPRSTVTWKKAPP
jgi:hypothetical protein